ncbi:hypothetical protein [Streptomyces bullii]|uniref:Uncharacterized protein n=1 Tax=Streptomyces bullii TaxID=349910 RepID=A0ABW0V5B6_9ACTN
MAGDLGSAVRFLPSAQCAFREDAVLPLVGGHGSEVATVTDRDDLRQRGCGHGLALRSLQVDLAQGPFLAVELEV